MIRHGAGPVPPIFITNDANRPSQRHPRQPFLRSQSRCLAGDDGRWAFRLFLVLEQVVFDQLAVLGQRLEDSPRRIVYVRNLADKNGVFPE
jgi:hypothetical protein